MNSYMYIMRLYKWRCIGLKSLLALCAVISLVAGIAFFAITRVPLMFVMPFVVNFSFVGIGAIAYKIMVREEAIENEEDKEFNAYKGAHSL